MKIAIKIGMVIASYVAGELIGNFVGKKVSEKRAFDMKSRQAVDKAKKDGTIIESRFVDEETELLVI